MQTQSYMTFDDKSPSMNRSASELEGGNDDPLGSPLQPQSRLEIHSQSTPLNTIVPLSSNDEDSNGSSASSVDDNVSILTFLGAVANLCSATLGAGVLSLPFAFEQAGLVCGTTLLLGSAWATSASINLLVVACDKYGIATYERVVNHLLGKAAKQVVDTCILLFCVGVAVAYLIAVGDILEQAILAKEDGTADDSSASASRRWAIAVVWLLSMLPLSCLRRIQSLQCASGVGLSSIGILVVASVVHLAQHFYEPRDTDDDFLGGDGAGLSFFQEEEEGSVGASGHWFSEATKRLKPFVGPADNSIISLARACPIVFFAFSCQVNVCQIYDELPGGAARITTDNNSNDGNNSVRLCQNKIKTMSRVTWLAVGMCAILYTSISIVTLMDFGVGLKPNILTCYHPKSHQDALLHIAFLAMAIAVVMAFPLNIFPARVSIIQIINGSAKPATALQVEATRSEAEGEGAMLHLPLLHQSDTEDPLLGGQILEQNRNGYEKDELDGEDQEETIPFNLVQHVSVTLLVAGLALGLALVVPNISVVFGLLGGTTGSLLGFVFPGLLGLQMDRSDLTAWALVVGGGLVGVLTTGVTLFTTFQDLRT